MNPKYSVRKTISEEQVNQIFDSCVDRNNCYEYLGKLFAEIGFDITGSSNLVKINGFPKAGRSLNEYIMSKARQKDIELGVKALAGGAWLNYGWSNAEGGDLWDWEVSTEGLTAIFRNEDGQEEEVVLQPGPKFKHDCARCQFLGHHKGVDLYFCDGDNGRNATVIARYSEDGPDYASGLEFGVLYIDEEEPKNGTEDPTAMLGTALRLAMTSSLIGPEAMNYALRLRRRNLEIEISNAMYVATHGATPRTCDICAGLFQVTVSIDICNLSALFQVSCYDCGTTIGYYDDLGSAVAVATKGIKAE